MKKVVWFSLDSSAAMIVTLMFDTFHCVMLNMLHDGISHYSGV